jgi:oxygen-dependent protoporphyrinogen oxidase
VRVVVVGGGIGGLVAARDLAKGGADVVLVEAGDELGGMLRTHSVAGLELDLAADSFATRGDIVSTLAIELGLGNELVLPDPRGAWLMTSDRRTAPLPAAGLLGIPSTPMAADVLAIIGTAAGVRAQLDSLIPAPVGAKAVTLGELVRKRMGPTVLEQLVLPIVAGVHSTHPDDLELDRVAPGLRAALLRTGSLASAVVAQRAAVPAGSAVGGIRGGIARLVRELVADLDTYRVDVRLGTRAVRVDRGGVDLVRVATAAEDGEGSVERLDADHVVAGIADPTRTASARRTGIELVTLVVEQPELDAAPRGTGMLVHPDAQGVGAKALTHATVKWPWLAERADGRHVLRLSYAVGPQDGAVASAPGDGTGVGRSALVERDHALAAAAAADAAAMLGVPLTPANVHGVARVRWHGPDTEPAALADGVVGVGEASSGRGIAGIVGAARSRAAAILDT